ncbi:unnamed protein product [Microthlaspi erraticum]|uniref:Uncharacterized protein n=1 Tax=Microthlaspi erraticum TaxID=1685480 RepID=A0A6D2KLF5_9BRAS|nr:unnamed protein product [Microthlaspi erraticum]
MAPSDSSPTKPEIVLGNEKSQNEIVDAVGIQKQFENDKNAKPSSSHNAGSFYMPGMNTLCCGPEDYEYYLREMCGPEYYEYYLREKGRESPPSEECYEDMYAEVAMERPCDHHVNNNGVSLVEVCDENSHVDGGDNNGVAESTRVIYVPYLKVGLVIGAVATLRYLQPHFGDRIRILKDSEANTQRAVEITGSIAQIDFAEQLIDAVIAEENQEEPMEEETEKPLARKDGEALVEEVHAEQS